MAPDERVHACHDGNAQDAEPRQEGEKDTIWMITNFDNADPPPAD